MLTITELRSAIIQRAGVDRTFRSALLTDAQATISALAGGTIPTGFEFNPIAELELTDEELDLVAGGAGPTYACSSCTIPS